MYELCGLCGVMGELELVLLVDLYKNVMELCECVMDFL
jgi:hypothetical protein